MSVDARALTFRLLGHDCPLGSYPSLVVPVGELGHDLGVVFDSDRGREFVPIPPISRYVKHSDEVRARLSEFDYHADGLFAWSPNNVVSYRYDQHREFYRRLLTDHPEQPIDLFYRLSLAIEASDADLVAGIAAECVAEFRQKCPEFLNDWHASLNRELQSNGLPPIPSRALLSVQPSGPVSDSDPATRPWPFFPGMGSRPGDVEMPGRVGVLVERAQGGSIEAWDLLINANTQYLNEYFSFHHLGHVVDELTQETFVRAFERIATLQDPARFVPWLFAIARNLKLDHWRKAARYEQEKADMRKLADPTPSVDVMLIEEERQQRLMAAIASLPSRQRRVVTLRIVNGHSLDQIAEELGISKNAVRVSLHQALKRLSKVVGE